MVTSNDKWKLYFHVVGASKCRTFEIKIKQSIDFSKEPIHIVTNCQNLAKEVRACGKRGACMRLKRALEEERKNDNNWIRNIIIRNTHLYSVLPLFCFSFTLLATKFVNLSVSPQFNQLYSVAKTDNQYIIFGAP